MRSFLWLGALVLAVSSGVALAEPAFTLLLRVPFASGSAQLGEQARQRLDRAIPELKADYADSGFELAGHADNRGSESYNLDLSQRRARAVYEYLAANGMDMRFVYERGYGSSAPLVDNDTPHNRHRNRRVELRLQRGDGPGDIQYR